MEGSTQGQAGGTVAPSPKSKTHYRIYAAPGLVAKALSEWAKTLEGDGQAQAERLAEIYGATQNVDLVYLGAASGHERGQAVDLLLDQAAKQSGLPGKAIAWRADEGQDVDATAIAVSAHGEIPIRTEIVRRRRVGA